MTLLYEIIVLNPQNTNFIILGMEAHELQESVCLAESFPLPNTPFNGPSHHVDVSPLTQMVEQSCQLPHQGCADIHNYDLPPIFV